MLLTLKTKQETEDRGIRFSWDQTKKFHLKTPGGFTRGKTDTAKWTDKSKNR